MIVLFLSFLIGFYFVAYFVLLTYIEYRNDKHNQKQFKKNLDNYDKKNT